MPVLDGSSHLEILVLLSLLRRNDYKQIQITKWKVVNTSTCWWQSFPLVTITHVLNLRLYPAQELWPKFHLLTEGPV